MTDDTSASLVAVGAAASAGAIAGLPNPPRHHQDRRYRAYPTNDPLGLWTCLGPAGRRYFATPRLAQAVAQLCEWGVLDFEADDDVEAYLAIAASWGLT